MKTFYFVSYCMLFAVRKLFCVIRTFSLSLQAPALFSSRNQESNKLSFPYRLVVEWIIRLLLKR